MYGIMIYIDIDCVDDPVVRYTATLKSPFQALRGFSVLWRQ